MAVNGEHPPPVRRVSLGDGQPPAYLFTSPCCGKPSLVPAWIVEYARERTGGRLLLEIIGLALKNQILYYIYGLAVLLPNLAVGVRRLHDTGKSGWWLLIGLIPIVGWIVLLVFFVTAGQPGNNQYGPDPKLVPATA